MSRPTPRPEDIVRVVVAVLLGIHGAYRALSGGATDFGGYLSSVGLPAGPVLAWGITIFEMVGAVLLVLGRWVHWVAAGYILILTGGVALVHAREGWFVVGAGRNGVEYSLLLIACLASLILGSLRSRR